ncbi:MAG: HD-GYP domain-containing protein [Chloroflexi bacterium]|nr:HD-GYP domain-containing protein [Chloroflexota bacterium]
MPKTLKLFNTLLVVAGAIALVTTGFVFRLEDFPSVAINLGDPAVTGGELVLGISFWTLATFLASALPVQMPGGILVTVSIAPIIAATSLGGPFAGALVALIGTTEIRELRGRVPWYGSLVNHAGLVVSAVACGLVIELIREIAPAGLLSDLFATVVGAVAYFGLNLLIVSVVVGLKVGMPIKQLLVEDSRGFAASLLALAPLGWLMARMYATPGAGWWTTLLFALPLYTTRVAYHRFVEMRDMFTQTIGALAEAVDKRDPFTSKHSQNVRMISVDIGREMRVSAGELEALEWGGLLHDVGKIGVPDNILLKQERLTREERMVMNAHPVLGAEIIAPVTKLAAELPIIRHHHEWYNGSGYPDRLMGDEIPKLARILHCADAFEAMTAARPYRMTPLTNEQALAELRKFAGIQFDPEVVDAFVRTKWAEDVRDPGRHADPRPIPLISQHAARTSQPAFDGPAPGSPAADLA